MARNTRRRPKQRATLAAFALILGGGGMMAANVYASATEEAEPGDAQVFSGATIDCPDVNTATQLASVPEEARPEVDKELASLDVQIADAYKRLGESADALKSDPGFAENAIAGPLKEKRSATLARIATAIDRVGDRPEGLEELAGCAVRESGNAPAQPDAGQEGDGGEEAGDGGDGQGQQDQDQQDQGEAGQDQGGNGGQAGNGPVAGDYVDIESVQPNVSEPKQTGNASRGTFTSECGVNENGLFNSDNVIAAPGVGNGAHHFHDYIGNQATNAFSSDDDLAAADTSCEDQGDKSSYYWPVLRLQNGVEEQDANAPGGGIEGNVGEIVTPKQVTLSFEGNPQGEVTAMPRLLRIITGDAKSFVNGPGNANASWSCTGFEDRRLTDKYPLCPQGSDVVRTFDFQSCWDGRNIDSANHRTHMAFADAAGNCPSGFKPVPQLVQRIVYDVDAPSLNDGGKTTPLFAVDAFPEQLHKPITDHGDFINVFDEGLMNEMVDCINEGRTCGPGAGGDGGNGDGGNGGGDQGEEPQQPEEPTATPDDPGQGDDGNQNDGGDQGNGDKPGDGGDQDNGGDKPGNGGDQNNGGQEQPSQDPADPADPAPEEPGNGDATAQPDVKASLPAQNGENGGDAGAGNQDGDKGGKDDGGQAAQAAEVPGSLPELGTEDRTGAQAQGGSLAETGGELWPAALGGVLVIFGFFVLRSVRRNA